LCHRTATDARRVDRGLDSVYTRWRTEVIMLGSLGLPELLIILVIVVIIFGAGKLPRLGRGLGEGIRNFKDSIKGDDTDKTEPPTDTKNEN